MEYHIRQTTQLMRLSYWGGCKHIVMVGLGGGSLAKFCYRYLRKTKITVVEIDAEIIAMREEFCVPKDNHRFRIVHDDGAHYISTLTDPVDVMLVDAFDSTGLAPSLSDSDFYSQAASALSANGVLVMNLSGELARYPKHINRICAAFNGSTLLVPVVNEGNELLFAFKQKLALTDSDEYMDIWVVWHSTYWLSSTVLPDENIARANRTTCYAFSSRKYFLLLLQ